MPQRSALLVLGLGIVAACNGAAKVAMDAGGDGPTADGPTTDAGSEAEAGLIDGQPSDASGDTLSEAAAAYCAMYLDASDPASACGAKNCCSPLFTCQISQQCQDFYQCEVDTPLDAAPPDSGDPVDWIEQYCKGQDPEGYAQASALATCTFDYCGDSGLGM
jgi:hypothetical protein